MEKKDTILSNETAESFGQSQGELEEYTHIDNNILQSQEERGTGTDDERKISEADLTLHVPEDAGEEDKKSATAAIEEEEKNDEVNKSINAIEENEYKVSLDEDEVEVTNSAVSGILGPAKTNS